MTADNIRYQIRDALSAVPYADFPAMATGLLAALGYRSERTLELSGGAEEFFQTFPVQTRSAGTERAFCEHVSSVQLIFQLTSEEIGITNQTNLFDDASVFDEGRQQSFMFFAVELKDASYARGRYAEFTREINKRLNQPSVVLFKTADNLLTLSFIHRRQHKRDTTRDVLGQVSLIREINLDNPHRAHLDILIELTLAECGNWMDAHNKPPNFDGLLAAWLDKLDTEQLNRQFYRELFAWFNRAVSEARFPTDEARTLSGEEHVIRLITRLLFVWFIKEKGLIASDLFVEERITELIKDYRRDTGDAYYRVVLQNLFFATLNTEINERGFSKRQNVTHRNFSLYRFKQEMSDPDALRAMFDQTPFINGGLFDCLDSEEATKYGGYRIDCFTDNVTDSGRNDYGILSIPNRLFFDDNGLFPLLNHYKFTVEENTPIEQEVALDPELLGKVFENLLAAYNPETKDTVRKQTGSYYTPREVVDYMVEEALVATLGETAHPGDSDTEFWQERLRYLLDYADAFNDADELFEEKEKKSIVRAIADLKVLDPAVGSGAFPMGVLHKLTLALQRLDPENKRWEKLQKERAKKKAGEAFDISDKKVRDDELDEISEIFERYSGDFGRKLYLIQNSIFGVDIQPVACQIAKLRFFISLAIEQKPDQAADNFGIKPLPNLESRFVVADTLLSLNKPDQMPLGQTDEVNRLEQELSENRERHFHATTRQQKLECSKENAQLRRDLAIELEKNGFPPEAAEKIARWDAYDQNDKADWFDAEYMFGIAAGFDVVIGNPPYIQLQKNSGELGKRYKGTGYETFASTGDIYQLFYEKGCLLLRSTHGLLAYITSNSWLKAEYGKALRRYFAERHTPLCLLEMGKDVFENAIVDTNILILLKGESNIVGKAVDMDRLPNKKFPPDDSSWGELCPQGDRPWMSLSALEQSIMDKMETIGTPLKEWDISIYRGILTGYNDAFIIDNETKEALIREDPKSAEIIKPVLRGRDIKRYQAQWAGLWMITTLPSLEVNIEVYPAIKRYLLSFGRDRLEQTGKVLPNGGKSRKKTPHEWFELQDTCAYHELFERNKILWMHMSPKGRFAYSDNGIYCNQKAFIMVGTSLKFLCAVLNSIPITWVMRNIAVTTGMGLLQWDKFTVETLPIPRITDIQQRPFIDLMNKILIIKAANVSADTTAIEKEIDKLTYQLYDLTDAEIEVLRGS